MSEKLQDIGIILDEEDLGCEDEEEEEGEMSGSFDDTGCIEP